MECVVNATPRLLYPRERHGFHCIGGWVGHRTGLDIPILWNLQNLPHHLTLLPNFTANIYRVIKKVSVHLMIIVQKNTQKLAITEYIRNTDYAILNTVFENTFRRVNKCLETVGQHFTHSSSSIGPRWLMPPDVLQP
jgi:hypothetical protein